MPSIDEGRATLMMVGAVALYSLFPLFNALSVQSIPPFLYVAKACIVACVIDILVIAVIRFRALFSVTHYLKQADYRYLAVAAVLATASYVTLVTGFSLGSNAAVTMLYELWPIFFMFMLPIAFGWRFKSISLIEIVGACVALAGLSLIIFSSGFAGPQSTTASGFSGEMLGLLAGLLMAVANYAKSRAIISEEKENMPVEAFAAIDFVNRGMAAGFALVGALIFDPGSLRLISQVDVSIGFGVIEGLGGLLYWLALSRTSRSSSHLLWYLAPVLGFVWLYAYGLGELNGPILFGAMMIFAANVLAHFRGEQTFAFFSTVVGAIGFGAIAYLTTSPNQTFGFTLISPPITLYSILVGFLLARLAERNFRQREACLGVLNGLPADMDVDARKAVVSLLSSSFRTGLSGVANMYRTLLNNHSVGTKLRSELSKIMLNRVSPISAGEIFSIISVGAIVVYVGFMGRPASFIGDMFAFILATVVVYLTVSIAEQKDVRAGEEWIMSIAAGLEPSDDHDSRQFIVAGVSLVLGIAVLVCIVLSLKHGGIH